VSAEATGPRKIEEIKERTLAWAKRGVVITATNATPTKRLKNKGFFAFFAEYGSTAEEGSVLCDEISLNERNF
jgi:hypothetical protein